MVEGGAYSQWVTKHFSFIFQKEWNLMLNWFPRYNDFKQSLFKVVILGGDGNFQNL